MGLALLSAAPFQRGPCSVLSITSSSSQKWSNAHKLPLWLKSPSGSISSVTLMLNASFSSVWQRRTQLSAPHHHHQQHHLQKWPAASNSLKRKTLTSRKLPMSSVPWCSAWTRASNHLKVPNLLPQLLNPLPSHQSQLRK